jgi:hypothetical protein
MRVQRGFSRETDRMRGGSATVKLGEDVEVRALAFQLKSGETERLVTNLKAEEVEDGAFKELYYKRWPIETKYNQLKQKLELENFSGRLVDNIKQDFYAMMTVANMLASCLREANAKAKKDREGKDNKYEYSVNFNHAVGVFKDQLIKVVIAEDPLVGKQLMDEMILDMKRKVIPIRPNRDVPRKTYLKKPHFHHNHKSNC